MAVQPQIGAGHAQRRAPLAGTGLRGHAGEPLLLGVVGLGDVKVKKFLNNVLQETLEPIRNRREELEKDPGYVMDVLRQGTEAAQAAAADTLAKVKHAMQIDYFA